MKFGCETNLNMQKAMLMSTFYHFNPLQANLVHKTKIGTCSNSDIQNFIMMLTRNILTRNLFLG